MAAVAVRAQLDVGAVGDGLHRGWHASDWGGDSLLGQLTGDNRGAVIAVGAGMGSMRRPFDVSELIGDTSGRA